MINDRIGVITQRLDSYDPESVVADVYADLASLTVQANALADEVASLSARVSGIEVALKSIEDDWTPLARGDEVTHLDYPWCTIHDLRPEHKDLVNQVANLFMYASDHELVGVNLTKLGGDRSIGPTDLDLLEPLIWQYLPIYYSRKRESEEKVRQGDYVVRETVSEVMDYMRDLRKEKGLGTGSTHFVRLPDKRFAVMEMSQSFRAALEEYQVATRATMRQLKATDLEISLTEGNQ